MSRFNASFERVNHGIIDNRTSSFEWAGDRQFNQLKLLGIIVLLWKIPSNVMTSLLLFRPLLAGLIQITN